MYKGSGPRILPIVVTIIVVAVVITALVALGRMLFSNSTSTNQNQSTTTSSLAGAILDTSANRSVRWTVRGPIVAQEKFRSYQITISPSARTYTLYAGYLDQVINTHTYTNNTKAYEEFVYALDKTNLSITRTVESDDIRGVCATQGIAYKFETLKDSTADQTLWSTTCKDSKGSMTADALKVQALFVNQIPDFSAQFNTIY